MSLGCYHSFSRIPFLLKNISLNIDHQILSSLQNNISLFHDGSGRKMAASRATNDWKAGRAGKWRPN
jgi:hypothetical protein